MNISGATVLTPRQWSKHRRALPKSWIEAAGMLEGKLPKDPVAWQRQIRAEWDERLAHQIKLVNRRDD